MSSVKLYRETLCEHDWMRPHALTDGQGLAERNIVGRCPGGSREEVVIDYKAATDAVRHALNETATAELIAESAVLAALKSAGFTKTFTSEKEHRE